MFVPIWATGSPVVAAGIVRLGTAGFDSNQSGAATVGIPFSRLMDVLALIEDEKYGRLGSTKSPVRSRSVVGTSNTPSPGSMSNPPARNPKCRPNVVSQPRSGWKDTLLIKQSGSPRWFPITFNSEVETMATRCTWTPQVIPTEPSRGSDQTTSSPAIHTWVPTLLRPSVPIRGNGPNVDKSLMTMPTPHIEMGNESSLLDGRTAFVLSDSRAVGQSWN